MNLTEVDFASLLRAHRLQAGLSQEQLADRANLSPRGISDLERGVRRAPYRPTVAALAKALGLDARQAREFEESVDRSRPIRTRTAPRGMPRPVSSLIGREEAVVEICELVVSGRARLLTLIGPGGVGKTRVALEVGRRALEVHAVRTALVRLEDVDRREGLIPALATELGVERVSSQPALELVAANLFGEPSLLILDNFEHLLEAAGDVVNILERCPNLSVLVTSRSVLNVRGEQLYPITPLGLPDGGLDSAAALDLAEINASPSVQLFTERVRERIPSFAVTEADCEDVRGIVDSLEGLPLAIELAAARSTALSLKQIREGLARRLLFLSDGPQDLPTRQRTFRDTLSWSYGLLNEREKRLFRGLSVLRGVWSLEFAGAVYDFEPGITEEEMRLVLGDEIASLVRQSLIIRLISQGNEARYRMPELTREFAASELANAGEADSAKNRLLTAVVCLALEAKRGLAGPDMEAWCDSLDVARENIQAALNWALEAGEFDAAAEIVSLVRSWFYGSSSGWMASWLDEALTDPRLVDNASARARLLAVRGFLYSIEGRVDDSSFSSLNASIPLLRQMGHRSELAQALATTLRFYPSGLDADEARQAAEESLRAFRKEQDWSAVASLLVARALASVRDRRLAEAESDCNEVLSMDALIDPVSHDSALLYLGCIRILEGDLLGARRVLENTLLSRRFLPAAYVLVTRARISQRLLETSRAASEYGESLIVARSTGRPHAIPLALEGVAWLAACRLRDVEAARLLGAAEAMPNLGHGRFDSIRDRDEVRALVAERLGEEAWQSALADGKRLPLDRAIAEALEEIEEDLEPAVERGAA